MSLKSTADTLIAPSAKASFPKSSGRDASKALDDSTATCHQIFFLVFASNLTFFARRNLSVIDSGNQGHSPENISDQGR
jgi:hypothetical protein